MTYAPGAHAAAGSEAQVTSGIDYGAETPAAPAYEGAQGYAFVGWSPELSAKVTETVTYVAQWEAQPDQLEYNQNFEVEGEEPQTMAPTEGRSRQRSHRFG